MIAVISCGLPIQIIAYRAQLGRLEQNRAVSQAAPGGVGFFE